MKRLNQISKIIMLASLPFACVEEVKPPSLENVENKIVVNSVITPFLEEIEVEVSFSKKSFGILDDQFGNADDATVVISNGEQQETLTYDVETERYRISTATFPLKEGVTYRLDVTTNKGAAVYAETSLPKKITEVESLSYNTRNDRLAVSWIDIPGQENFYRISAASYFERDSGDDDPYFIGQQDFSFNNDGFISDFNRDGQKLSARGDSFRRDFDSVIVRIVTSNELYADYFYILRNFIENDPFVEPVNLPSNIVGGIGIFTAVQVAEFTLEL